MQGKVANWNVCLGLGRTADGPKILGILATNWGHVHGFDL